MLPLNECPIEVLAKRVAHYRQRALDEQERFGELLGEMNSALEAAKAANDKADEFHKAINLLREASK